MPPHAPISGCDVLHLSVLNPVDHPRMTLRLAATQAQAGWRVCVVGVASSGELPASVTAIGLPAVDRRNLLARRRRLAELEALACRLRPRLLVIHSPELAPVALRLRRHLGCALWYDVHEDYALNFRHHRAYPALLRRPLAAWATHLERSLVPHLAAATYAEACFGNRLALPPDRWLTAPNLYHEPAHVIPPTLHTDLPLMLTTGTLAADWGLFDALALWQRLNRSSPLHWAVVGHAPQPEVIPTLLRAVAQSGSADRFTLVGGREPVPYAEVVGWIRRCTFGTALYRLSPAIAERIPSKVYEYIAHRKPLVAPPNPAWGELQRLTAFAVAPDAVEAALAAHFSASYTQPIGPSLYRWDAFAPQLIALTQRVLG